MSQPLRVVFDCNVYLQALARPQGPAGACVTTALEGKVALFVSNSVLAEIQDVATRPELVSRFRIRADALQRLIDNLGRVAVLIADVPAIWTYQRDPDDAHYVDLALAAEAHLIVSRDKDLLDLMTRSDRESIEFRRRFPLLRVIDPVGFLRELSPT